VYKKGLWKRELCQVKRAVTLKLIKARMEGESLQPVIHLKKKKILIIIVPASARIEIQFI